MSQLEAYAAHVPSGTAGASHTLTSSFGTVSPPGQKMWLTFIYEATRTTGTSILTLDAKVRWYDISDVEITPASVQSTSINATVGRTFKEFAVTVPANATKAKVEFVLTPAASPMQHNVWISSVRFAKTQLVATAGATWGVDIANPSGTLPEDNATMDANVIVISPTFIYCDSAGAPKSGEITKEIQISLVRQGNVLTSGMAWVITHLSGNAIVSFTQVNGYINLQITGPNDATLSLENVFRIKSIYNNVTRTVDLVVRKQLDPPTNSGSSGGSGSQASTNTLGSTTSTSYDLTNAISQTLICQAGPLGEVFCAAPIAFTRQTPKVAGATATRGKWQWRVPAGAWADVGVEVASSQDAETDESAEGFLSNAPGNLSVGQIKNGLTPGSTYEFRFVWRRIDVSGTAKNVNHASGTMTATGR